MGAWNALLEQLGQAKAESKQMKVCQKCVPFNKRNTQPQNIGSKQNNKQRHVSNTKANDDKGQTVNKIEVSNESKDEEDISYPLWNSQMENNENTEPSHTANNEETNPQINVILLGNSMALEFPFNIGSYATKCLFDSRF